MSEKINITELVQQRQAQLIKRDLDLIERMCEALICSEVPLDQVQVVRGHNHTYLVYQTPGLPPIEIKSEEDILKLLGGPNEQ